MMLCVKIGNNSSACMAIFHAKTGWVHGPRSHILAWDDWTVIQLLVSFTFRPEEIPFQILHLGDGNTGSHEQSTMAVFHQSHIFMIITGILLARHTHQYQNWSEWEIERKFQLCWAWPTLIHITSQCNLDEHPDCKSILHTVHYLK